MSGGHDDDICRLNSHHVVLVLRCGLLWHPNGRGRERRRLHNLRGRLLQDIRRLSDVRGLPDGHDDLDHGRDGVLVLLVLQHRLHGHADFRGH